jgi:UPF0716 family protein affecting phage T7 exclusion
LTPGFLTDAVGFALLYPGTRQIIKNRVRRKFSRSLHVEYREL